MAIKSIKKTRRGRKPPENVKVWPHIQAFLKEFTDRELNNLANNTTVAGVGLRLAVWRGEVWSSDAELNLMMTELVNAGIINRGRKNKIMNV